MNFYFLLGGFVYLSTLKIFVIFLSFLREPEKTQGQIFMDVTGTMYAV